MTYHTSSRRAAGGSVQQGGKSPRIVVSLPPADMELLTWWAAKKGVPVATVLRNAVWSYLQCVRPDFERERGQ